MSEETIYGVDRAKFDGFGKYKLPIEKRVNEILELTKKEYPEMDNFLMWLCAVDFVMDEMGLKKDCDEGQKFYEKYLKERKTFIYKGVSVEEGNKIKAEYNVLQEVGEPGEDDN
jgi:hypothetical protein